MALALVSGSDKLDNPCEQVGVRWTQYKSHFNKRYHQRGENIAFAAFADNDAIIQNHNKKNLSWKLGHNIFSDLSWDDFKATHLGLVINADRTKVFAPETENLVNSTTDDALDWVAKGAVTAVKTQGMCGSCWAFSTTGALEGAFQINGNPLTSFSEEELVACENNATGGADQGCSGGEMDNAFKWVEKNGLCTESDYPYTSKMGGPTECKLKSCDPAVGLTGYYDVKNETGMIQAISKGPVSVALEADKSAFQLYKSGVLDSSTCGRKLDHGVLVVGYGTDGDKAYYKVKNSWGATWGEAGYLRIVQGKDMCGIADSASYPTGVKPFGPPPTPPPATPTPAPPPPDAKYRCEPRKKACVVDSGSVFTKIECEDKCK